MTSVRPKTLEPAKHIFSELTRNVCFMIAILSEFNLFEATKKGNMVTAELLTIGDEILYGQIVDTNSQWMSVELSNAGIKVVRKTTVGDIESEILNAFAEAEQRADIVLITGGLGPT